MIRIDVLELGPIGANCYIVREEHSRDCVLIDPADAEKVLRFLEQNALKATHILLTHGHFDHIFGVAKLQERTGAEVCIHEKDASALSDNRASLASEFRCAVPPCRADRLLQGGERIAAAGLTFEVLFTPGHSPGGVCYLERNERVIFSGDTLFHLSVGRSDLSGGDEETLYRSIEEKLFMLPGDYKVYPGHMRETALEFERAHNPILQRRRDRA